MFGFYKTMLNLKTRLQEQNLKKIFIFFHYHLNLFICCKTKIYVLQNAFVLKLKNEFFYTAILFNRIKFLKGDKNIYFKQITFFEKIEIFCKNHTYFFLKNIIFFLQLSFATFEQP